MYNDFEWIERFLFGASTLPPTASAELRRLMIRMQVENIPWEDIVLNGGFTAFPYQVHGDLSCLLDHLKYSEPLVTPLKTRVVTRFWNELQIWMARQKQPLPLMPVPCKRDDEILKDLLEGKSEERQYEFQSAEFWGHVAQRFINLRRPDKSVKALSDCSTDMKRLELLFDVTCEARGQILDPLHLVMVPHSEHVNAAHWSTERNLEAFMRDRPTHPLTLSVQALLERAICQLLNGEKPSALLKASCVLDALLHNIRVIHESVQQVPDGSPPKLIDSFQRLLALCYRDGLWEKEVPVIEASDPLEGTSLMYLTEQLRIADREKRILWQSVPEQHGHTYSQDSYARDRRCL